MSEGVGGGGGGARGRPGGQLRREVKAKKLTGRNLTLPPLQPFPEEVWDKLFYEVLAQQPTISSQLFKGVLVECQGCGYIDFVVPSCIVKFRCR